MSAPSLGLGFSSWDEGSLPFDLPPRVVLLHPAWNLRARPVISGRRAGNRLRQGATHLPKLKWPIAQLLFVSQLMCGSLILVGDPMGNYSYSEIHDHATPSAA